MGQRMEPDGRAGRERKKAKMPLLPSGRDCRACSIDGLLLPRHFVPTARRATSDAVVWFATASNNKVKGDKGVCNDGAVVVERVPPNTPTSDRPLCLSPAREL